MNPILVVIWAAILVIATGAMIAAETRSWIFASGSGQPSGLRKHPQLVVSICLSVLALALITAIVVVTH